MPFGKMRTDVREALAEALASAAWIRMHVVAVGGGSYHGEGYVKNLVEDRVVIDRNRGKGHGLTTMLSDIRWVAVREEPGDSSGPDPRPVPVGGPPPTSMSPGKREKVPASETVDSSTKS